MARESTHVLASASSFSRACEKCGFELWLPIVGMSVSDLGLYSDVRFPGRCIITLREHYDHIDQVQGMEMVTFMEDVRFAVDAIRRTTGCERVNVAILGNEEKHVHAHLVPRFPKNEPKPNKAPWEDTRPKGQLPTAEEDALINGIRATIDSLMRSSLVAPAHYSSRRREYSIPAPSPTLFDLLSDE